MLRFTHKSKGADQLYSKVVLPYEKRIKCRLRVTLENGEDAGIVLARGEILRNGDYLHSEEGHTIRVVSADEVLSQVNCDDPLLFARACYHLGNRHVPLQIHTNVLSYQHDHVLDDMIRGLGLHVHSVTDSFEPEPGAYGGDSRAHHHSHGHSH